VTRNVKVYLSVLLTSRDAWYWEINLHAIFYGNQYSLKHTKGKLRTTGWTLRVQFPGGQASSFFHNVQAVSGAHSVSFRMCTGCDLPGDEVARAWNWSLPLSAEVKNGGAIPPFPHMSLWYNAWLIKHENNFTSYFYSDRKSCQESRKQICGISTSTESIRRIFSAFPITSAQNQG
jgi:hypothetical protein